ncbi:MAG: BRCT domain-containing protein [Alphaproteobacteria bacterium]|nr:BRCT domain-containing protein [Alphaproteobacteria bacterium]
MDSSTRLVDVQLAWQSRDPDLPRMVAALAGTDEPRFDGPIRDDDFTLQKFKWQLRGYDYRRGKPADRQRVRTEGFAKLAADPRVPAPDRLKLDALLLELYAADDAYARGCLLEIIATVPLRWGPWRALKQIFKQAEATGDVEVFGALTARLDMALANRSASDEIRRPTLTYLVRRAWRTLRRIGEALPAVYPDAAVEILRCYPEDTNWRNAWIANHVFYHAAGQYSRTRFRFRQRPSTLLKHRAFADLWRRTPRPLFNLLERARSEQARRFATDALRSDFRTSLRTVEPAWVERLVHVDSSVVHDFVIWLLDNVPRFEQAAFHELGLHEPVLLLLDSPSSAARAWAAEYARTHARDLALERLVLLANNDHEAVRKMAQDLLRARHPRDAVGLEAWGRLLGTRHAHDLAADAIRKHFGASELTPDWFRERLLSDDREVFRFAADLLLKVHTHKKLGAAFFTGLIEDERLTWLATSWTLDALSRFSPDELGADFVQRALVLPASRSHFADLVDQDRVKAADLGADFLKVLAFEPTWEASAWVHQLRTTGPAVYRDLSFDHGLAGRALAWLGDVRRFSPDQLGFDWLMQLVQRTEPLWHEFAVEYMIKAFVPADFAEQADAAPAEEAPPSGEINIDLGGQSFLFTGKLSTMSRGEATKKVTAAGGKNASGVNQSLDYLVIGDEGSPLYGQGRKGSKQVKAEKLIEAGAGIRIISETAFLQMLAGEQRSFDEGTVEAGATRLWEMATNEGRLDTPLARFALRYLRRHHPDIGLEMTDRHVDPGAEIPEDFLSFERVRPLFTDPRPELRALALDFARFEFARWAPPMPELVALSEAPFGDVRAFVTQALLADDSRDHARYRVDPARLTADAVYRFCESLDPATRALGMTLIQRNPRLAIPEELFRLTESPDRQVRAFVIRHLWGLYRSRAVTVGWTPPKADAAAVAGRPEALPAEAARMRDFMRTVLFGIPPARPPKPHDGKRTRPLPARKAKLGLVEVMRDLAVEDAAFAGLITPLLREFMSSRGQSEHAACMVALARIARAHPELPLQES